MKPHERVLVALDTPDAARARALVGELASAVGGVKVGSELFASAGPELVRELRAAGAVFVDLKLHDIPNTVAGAAAALGRLGAAFFTMHALGGAEMLRAGARAAREAAQAAALPPPLALAVTILTSHDDALLRQVGIAGPCGTAVRRLAELARESGVDGVVCSPLEVAAVREVFPDGVLVVPGIRPAGSAADDQRRFATPAGAVRAGADRLVIGRPITGAERPAAVARAIAAEIETA